MTDSTALLCRQRWLCVLVLLALTACTSPIKRADELERTDAWHEAVMELRKAAREDPKSVEVRSRLAQTQMRAAEHFHARAMQLAAQGETSAAIDALQNGLSAAPTHEKLQQALASLLAQQEADSLHEEGQRLQSLGSTALAMARWQLALQRQPGHAGASQALADAREAGQGDADGLALTSRAPITLNFRQTDLRAAFEFLAKAFGINVIFDEGLRSTPVTLMARDVTFEQGLGLMLATSRTFYKRLGPNTILVAPDTKEKRGQYEEHLVRTLHLNTIRAKEMADILKGLVSVRKLVVNESANALLVRDTQEVIRVVERIVDASDRKPAELLLEVEILAVNRSKSEKLGLDFGSYALTAALPPPSTVPIGTSIGSAFRSQGAVTVPSVTLRLFKQDVDAKTLANPKVRVVSGKLARIHIGDRVPLRAATIVDATGQTRTTFDYREVGIKLQVEPTIHLDHSTLVKLGLEVSSLGENLGTASEPAFRIGTRNAETFMVLRDGETAILGGLIRDEERNTRVRIPGLGDVPPATPGWLARS